MNQRIVAPAVAVWIGLLICAVHAQPAPAPRLAAKHSEVLLFTAPDETSAVIARLQQGEEIEPLADLQGSGGHLWYFVKAKSGAVGWMRPADIEQRQQNLEDLFKSAPLDPAIPIAPDIPSTPSTSLPDNAVAVRVEMNGPAVIVPVSLNRSLSTRLILDTGATATIISRRIANRLGLSLGPRIVMATANGTFTAPLARLGSIKVGEAEAYNFLVPVHDFHPDPRIEGLLGLDFLKRFHMSIDSRRRLLILAPR